MVPRISIAVVSHGQGKDVVDLFESLALHLPAMAIEIILIENLYIGLTDLGKDYDFEIIRQTNEKPRGYSENLNAAFELARGEYFCILNPDVIFVEEVFSELIASMEEQKIDLIGPLIVNSAGMVQDSYRSLPTPLELILRWVGGRGTFIKEIPHEAFLYPDWIAAIFILTKAATYEFLGGFNPAYRLYFEDVDFCCRAWLKGLRVGLHLGCRVVHDAERKSKNDLYYLLIHISSAIKFFASDIYWKFKRYKKHEHRNQSMS